MTNRIRSIWVCGLALWMATACGDDATGGSNSSEDSGGSAGTGGSAETGGSADTGGSAGTGGSADTGGSAGTGGSMDSGGSGGTSEPSSGGAPDSGGSDAGGAPSNSGGSGAGGADADPCATANGGCDQQCTPGADADDPPTCSCDAGFELEADGTTCTQIGACAANGGCDQNCAVTSDGLERECSCDPGYELADNGTTCTDINECEEDSGGCSDGCEDATTPADPPTCTCPVGTQLDTDDSTCIDSDECEEDNGGCHSARACVNAPTSGDLPSCGACAVGYEDDGPTDCVDIDECVPGLNPCGTAPCTNLPGGPPQCGDCPVGTTGQAPNCINIDECTVLNPCDPLTTCADSTVLGQSPSCSACPTGYSGTGLTGCTELNECELGTDNCFDHPDSCANTTGSFQCSCPAGYTGSGVGPSGCIDDNECVLDTDGCFDHVDACVNTTGGFECGCPDGYTGDGVGPAGCLDVDECLANTDNCSSRPEACVNTVGGFTCACPLGYTGAGTLVSACTDVDECLTGTPCPGDRCTNIPGSVTCGAVTWYVCDPVNDQDQLDCLPGGDGLSWDTAFDSLSAALDPLRANFLAGDQIWVGAGRYFLSANREDTFLVPEGITLLAGFRGGETDGRLQSAGGERDPFGRITSLNADVNQDEDDSTVVEDFLADIGENNCHTVTLSANTVFDGFRVRGGNADGDCLTQVGGGVVVLTNATSVQINNAELFENNADSCGGALYVNTGAEVTIRRAIIGRPHVFSNFGNFTGGDGAGACFAATSSATLERVVFAGNEAEGNGGGVFGVGATINQTNVLYTLNQADEGAGLYGSSGTITHATFSGNTSSGSAGAIFLPTPEVLDLFNSVAWGDLPAEFSSTGTLTVQSCDVQGGIALPVVDGGGNVTDPLSPFVDINSPPGPDDTYATTDDGLRVLTTSLASGAADPNESVSEALNERSRDGEDPDMGCYQGQPTLPPPPAP